MRSSNPKEAGVSSPVVISMESAGASMALKQETKASAVRSEQGRRGNRRGEERGEACERAIHVAARRGAINVDAANEGMHAQRKGRSPNCREEAQNGLFLAICPLRRTTCFFYTEGAPNV